MLKQRPCEPGRPAAGTGQGREAHSVLRGRGFRMENSRNFAPNDGSTAYTFVGAVFAPLPVEEEPARGIPASSFFRRVCLPVVSCGTCRGTSAAGGEGVRL